MIRRLVGIVGRRTLLSFGLVSALVGALLATVNVTSRYALKLYVDDQLRRIPWDLAVYQQGTLGGDRTLQSYIAQSKGVERVESLAFLRARFPENGEVRAQVDGRPFITPWLCLLSASQPSILPPELGYALARAASVSGGRGAVLALVGPEFSIGRSLHALQGARDFSLYVQVRDRPRLLFSTPISGVVRLDREELNRWLMGQTGSVSYIPYIAAILLMPHEWNVLASFDLVASGFVPTELLDAAEQDLAHIQLAEYAAELVYLARVDRSSLVSGWDIPGSLARLKALNTRLRYGAFEAAAAPTNFVDPSDPAHGHAPGEADDHGDKFGGPASFVVDSTTEVLLEQLQGVARLIGLVSLLVALPLLWMAWVLAANLARLLMLNERRTLGLLRLRGVPGDLLGRALLVCVAGGAFGGGLLGLAAGSVVPLLLYEGGRLPAGVLAEPRQLGACLVFLLVSVLLALAASRRLLLYAITISPLQASLRVSDSETAAASLAFGLPQRLALLLGTYALAGWMLDFSLSARFESLRTAGHLLDFLGLPLFLYGAARLLASNAERIRRLMAPMLRPIGGALGHLALRHMSARPHRAVVFLLIVALMSSLSLYPVITSGSFEDRSMRGARLKVGADWQVLFNAPDLVRGERLSGGADEQLAALLPEADRLTASLRRLDGVRAAAYLIETVLPSFYLPGYGLRGVPLYLLSPDAYRAIVYSEPSVGLSAPFDDVIARTRDGSVAVSPAVAEFWSLSPGTPLLLGLDPAGRPVSAKAAGVLAYLPGMPPRTVSDRQGYVRARVEYLNHVFGNSAYLVAARDGLRLGSLPILIPRVIVLLKTDGGVDPAAFRAALARATPSPPLEIHSLADEASKLGGDMYVSLALANMRIYLLGGLALALVAILSVAMANYREDRRTLALLRIRGTSPALLWRFVVATLLSPALLGLAVGAASAVVAGFGLAAYLWRLREMRTVVHLLATRLVVGPLAGWVLLLLLFLLIGVASGFSWWVYRRTARESLQEV